MRAPHDWEMDLCPPAECFMIFNGTLVLRVSAQAKAHTPQDPRCRTGHALVPPEVKLSHLL